MKRYYLMFTSLTLFFSCSTLKEKQKDSFCDQMFNLAQKYWKYNDPLKYYEFIHHDSSNYFFNFIFNEQECWKGLSQKEVTKILKHPSRITDSTYEYFIFPITVHDCFNVQNSCIYWEIKFDQNRKVSSAYQRTRIYGRIVE